MCKVDRAKNIIVYTCLPFFPALFWIPKTVAFIFKKVDFLQQFCELCSIVFLNSRWNLFLITRSINYLLQFLPLPVQIEITLWFKYWNQTIINNPQMPKGQKKGWSQRLLLCFSQLSSDLFALCFYVNFNLKVNFKIFIHVLERTICWSFISSTQ